MDTTIIRRAGLTESQAKGYLALVEHGPLSPTDIAKKIGESRTNTYAIVDKLATLGLAIKQDTPKAQYAAAHPSMLEHLAERRRKAITQNERIIKEGISPLIDLFYARSETPGTRTLQGPEGLREVYNETLQDKQTIHLLRTTADAGIVSSDFLRRYREKRAALGIHTHAITPYTTTAKKHIGDGTDEQLLFHRTILPEDSYSAPVEIDVFGNKVALIAFGTTQIATIIESPPIAMALRQVLCLLTETLTANQIDTTDPRSDSSRAHTTGAS